MTNMEYWKSRHPVTFDDDGSGAYGDAWEEWVDLTEGDPALDNLSWNKITEAFSKWCDEKRSSAE